DAVVPGHGGGALMRWDLLAPPVDGVTDALEVVSGFDGALIHGLIRPTAEQMTALQALADAVSGSPLGRRVAEAADRVAGGSAADDHSPALAAARSALLGAVHDALLARLDEATGRDRSAWPTPPTPAEPYAENLLAASRSWLSD